MGPTSRCRIGDADRRGARSCVIAGLLQRVPEDGAEEPWYGHDTAPSAFSLENQTWRWPNQLHEGMMFSGTVEVFMRGQPLSAVRRDHFVRGMTEVVVPAGHFHARVVDTVDVGPDAPGERHDGSPGTYYIAEGVGLVRSEQHMDGGGVSTTLVHELVSFVPGAP